MTTLDWLAVTLFVLQIPVLWLWLTRRAIILADQLTDLLRSAA